MSARKGCIRIPLDLNLADTLVLCNGLNRQFRRNQGRLIEVFGVAGTGIFWLRDGRSAFATKNPEFDVVGFVRCRPRKTKDDRDARWLMSLVVRGDPNSRMRRLRAIAKRLNGGRAVKVRRHD